MVFGQHVLDRMVDRRFSEVELRSMLSVAISIRRDETPGRWIVNTRLRQRRWEIIVEPDIDRRLTIVVTAYRIGP